MTTPQLINPRPLHLSNGLSVYNCKPAYSATSLLFAKKRTQEP